MSTREPIVQSEAFPAHGADYLRDPYAYLGDLRARGPVTVDPGSGLWFLLRFADVEAGLSGQSHASEEHADRHKHFPDNPFSVDGPHHTAARRVIMPTFSNRAVGRFRDRAQAIVDEALAGKERGGALRVVEEVGFRLPYHLTCDILGVPAVGNADELRTWTWKSLELINAFLTPEELEDRLEASGLLAEHLREVMAWKRRNPGDDVATAVIAAGDAGEVMRPEQVIPYLHTLYLAGMHTTVNQTALSLYSLLRFRDQWELLRQRPALVENAVEELLRFEPTAQYMRRVVADDREIGDVLVPAGTELVCWIASANRDEDRWGPTAGLLDVTRSDARQHIAFGKGAHMCVGSWLARLELQVVVATILERYPNTTLPDQELTWESNVIRGPSELVVELVP